MHEKLVAAVLFLAVAGWAYADWNVPDDMASPGGIGGSGIGQTAGTPETSYLRLHSAISCYDEERATATGYDYATVIYNRAYFLDGTPVQVPPENYLNKPFWPAAPGLWSKDSSNNWIPDHEPGVSIFFDPAVPQFIRYEGRAPGGCYAYYMNQHDHYRDSGVTLLKSYCFPFDCSWNRVEPGLFQYQVDWDNQRDRCLTLGGAWLDSPGYDNWRCCGDDWIWLYNRPLNYAPRGTPERYDLKNQNALCLYSSTPSYGNDVDASTYFGASAYYCDYSGTGHRAYDSRLTFDTGVTYAHRDDPFYFIGEGATETDLGKWSDYSEENPMYCDIDFVNEAGRGIIFTWRTIAEAANKNQATCELFLGYNWTGSRCCGAPGNPLYYNDAARECDAVGRADQLVVSGVPLSHVTFQKRFQDLCNDYLTRNRACFEGRSVENNSVTGPAATPETRNIFNENGIIYVCEGDYDPAGNPDAYVSAFEVVQKCGTRGGYENLAVCIYSDDSWHRKFDTYSYDTLGYRDGVFSTLDELRESIHTSTLPAEVAGEYDIPTECCFNNNCWDGSSCVDSGSVYVLKQDGTWQDMRSYEASDLAFGCREGTWHGPLEPQFNWDRDTRNPGFCIDEHQCYCTDCPEKYVENGCTRFPYFFKDDHFCEGPHWTSRTKLLATQLMHIAQGTEYTLFCDSHAKSLNYYLPVEPVEDKVNSFCVLNSSGSITIGVSFRTANDPYSLDPSDVLFDPVDGFVRVVLGEDMSSCQNAIADADTGLGTFRRCMAGDSRIWYNNQTQTLIYSKEGLSLSEPMPWDYGTYNAVLQDNFHVIRTHINANAAEINTALLSIAPFRHASDFDRLYVAESGGSRVFGVLERKYDPLYVDNRQFLGVTYTGIDGISCGDILDAYDNSYCGSQGSTIVVLGRRVDESFRYWPDLTAKLRFR